MFSLGVSGFFNDLSMPGAWGACLASAWGEKLADRSPEHEHDRKPRRAPWEGWRTWLMKSMGLGWHGVLYVAAATYLVSALCWFFIDSDDRIHD